jgi:hypothetical protein
MDLGQDYHGDTYVFNENVGENMIQCNRGCGTDNLHWKIVNGKYKLFQNNNLLHMCNDGVKANKAEMRRVTDNILEELGLADPSDIPVAEVYEKKNNKKEEAVLWVPNKDTKDASKCFTINTTANGISLTGDDKHNAIFLPKIALPELVKALMDFI